MVMLLKNYLESHQYPRTQMLTNPYYYFLLWFIRKHFPPKPRKTLMSSVWRRGLLKIFEVVLTLRSTGILVQKLLPLTDWCEGLPLSRCYISFGWINLDSYWYWKRLFLVKLNETFQFVLKFSKTLICR